MLRPIYSAPTQHPVPLPLNLTVSIAQETYQKLHQPSNENLNTWIKTSKAPVATNEHKTRRQLQDAIEHQILKTEQMIKEKRR